VTALALLASAARGVRIARPAARASIPGRAGRSERFIDRGALFFGGWGLRKP